MKIQIWGCRGSIPRPNPEMARYGGNTPCIEVVASSSSPTPKKWGHSHECSNNNCNHGNDDGHRIILDLGSGAFDLGHKILGEMFQKQKKVVVVGETREEEEDVEESSKNKNDNVDSSAGVPKKQSKFGGSILITHTHWDHIQGACCSHFCLSLSGSMII
jgi:phosphoribosyl 1,2-cyclic phosphodiesterase